MVRTELAACFLAVTSNYYHHHHFMVARAIMSVVRLNGLFIGRLSLFSSLQVAPILHLFVSCGSKSTLLFLRFKKIGRRMYPTSVLMSRMSFTFAPVCGEAPGTAPAMQQPLLHTNPSRPYSHRPKNKRGS